jgi:hypothetical protein
MAMTTQEKRRRRGTALMTGFEIVGDVLLLQLLFLLASVPLVTIVPAAVALQRGLRKTVIEERPGLASAFFREFAWAWSRTWILGLIFPPAVAVGAFSVLFWLSSPGSVGTAALCVIVPLCGVAAAGYIAFLAASMTAPDETTGQTLIAETRAFLLAKAMPLAGTVLALSTWLLLVLRLPTLIPVGSGLVPAFLAWMLVRRRLSAGNVPG